MDTSSFAPPDPRDRIKVFQNFFDHEDDLAVLREGVRIIRRFTMRPEMDPFRGQEIDPGPSVMTNDEIDDWTRRSMTTAYHPVGTCAMGTGPMAVLDPDLRLRGFEGIRVVDASAMPDLPSGNTNVPVLMMAAKAADAIKQARYSSTG